MHSRFAMTRRATDKLARLVYQQWHQEDTDRRPHQKQAAIRRLQDHVLGARKAGNWNAVMQGERLLAQIQGTLEPVEVHINVDAEIRETVAVLLTQLPQERIDAMAEKALQLRKMAGIPPPQLEEEPRRLVEARTGDAERP